MSNLKKTVEYKVGDVYLCDVSRASAFSEFEEAEIISVSLEGRAVKVRTKNKVDRWESIADFHRTVREYMGRYKTVGRWFWRRRVLVRASGVRKAQL